MPPAWAGLGSDRAGGRLVFCIYLGYLGYIWIYVCLLVCFGYICLYNCHSYFYYSGRWYDVAVRLNVKSKLPKSHSKACSVPTQKAAKVNQDVHLSRNASKRVQQLFWDTPLHAKVSKCRACSQKLATNAKRTNQFCWVICVA